MKKTAVLVAVAVAAVLVGTLVYVNLPLFLPIGTQDCGSDPQCLEDSQNKKGECIPSSFIVEGRDGIRMMVNITREGDRCIRTEEVIGSGNPDSSYLIGHNTTCEYELAKSDDPLETACPGSLYEYVLPEGGGGGWISPQGTPRLDCSLEDSTCKDAADQSVQTCSNSQIVNTELKWEPEGYWTVFINVSRQPEDCLMYFEVLNAVNLPPGIPAAVVGSNMTCSIPLSSFPISNLTATWCAGELYAYIYP